MVLVRFSPDLGAFVGPLRKHFFLFCDATQPSQHTFIRPEFRAMTLSFLLQVQKNEKKKSATFFNTNKVFYKISVTAMFLTKYSKIWK